MSLVDSADHMPRWPVVWAPSEPAADRVDMVLALDVPEDATVGPEDPADPAGALAWE